MLYFHCLSSYFQRLWTEEYGEVCWYQNNRYLEFSASAEIGIYNLPAEVEGRTDTFGKKLSQTLGLGWITFCNQRRNIRGMNSRSRAWGWSFQWNIRSILAFPLLRGIGMEKLSTGTGGINPLMARFFPVVQKTSIEGEIAFAFNWTSKNEKNESWGATWHKKLCIAENCSETTIYSILKLDQK